MVGRNSRCGFPLELLLLRAFSELFPASSLFAVTSVPLLRDFVADQVFTVTWLIVVFLLATAATPFIPAAVLDINAPFASCMSSLYGSVVCSIIGGGTIEAVDDLRSRERSTN